MPVLFDSVYATTLRSNANLFNDMLLTSCIAGWFIRIRLLLFQVPLFCSKILYKILYRTHHIKVVSHIFKDFKACREEEKKNLQSNCAPDFSRVGPSENSRGKTRASNKHTGAHS